MVGFEGHFRQSPEVAVPPTEAATARTLQSQTGDSGQGALRNHKIPGKNQQLVLMVKLFFN